MSVSDRIREVADVKSLSLKDLASATDTSYRTLQNYISGERGIGSEFLKVLSERLGVSASWVLTGKHPMFLDEKHPNEVSSAADHDFISIPRLAVEASAGNGVIVEAETRTGSYAFNRKWLTRRGLDPRALSVIEVSGDSMEPRLDNGDLILIDRSSNEISDGTAHVVRVGNELLVKYVQRISPTAISLISANPLYPPREIEIEQLGEEPDSQIKIVGRVVASMHEW